jgi:glucan-binding YG repeat protein
MKKAIAKILVVALCFSALSVGALADNEEQTPEVVALEETEAVVSLAEEDGTVEESAAAADAVTSQDEEESAQESEEISLPQDETPAEEPDSGDEQTEDSAASDPETDAEEASTETEEDGLSTDSAAVTPIDFSGMSNGWNYVGNNWYFVKNGASVCGWIKSGNSWYYMDPSNNGAMVTGWFDVPGDTLFYFDPSGAMQTGWVYTDSAWHYFRSSGRLFTGWLKSGGVWYYLDGEKAGAMATGWYSVPGDTTYYFSSSGAMQTGWVYNDNASAWRYLRSSGRLFTGWLQTGSVWTTKWYYLDPNNGGNMVTGWNYIDGYWYCMNSSGAMKTGWITSGNQKYYLTVTGKMATGWLYTNSSDYYFYTDADEKSNSSLKVGLMATNTVIDGRTVSSSGTASAVSNSVTDKAQYYSSETDNLLVLDRSSSKLYVFTGSTNNWSLSNVWSCAAGSSSTPTPSGTYTVQSKGTYFDSGSARCFWWTQFWGSYCFHSILYYQDGYTPSSASVMNSSVGSNISHGCVRLQTKNAKWVYDNVNSGTTVVVY